MASGYRARIEGALAVVTGAGSGIGRATAEALSARGARVVAVDLDGDAAKRTASSCEGHAASAGLDISERPAVEAFAGRALGEWGCPDFLVNNAGVGMTGRFLDMSAADWDWIVGTNLLGAIHLTRAFGPAMLARRSGQVVNVASALTYLPRASEPGYVTTKSALVAWSRCLRADWGRVGVGVSVVCPGVTATAIASSNTRYLGARADPEVREGIERRFARGARPETVAAAVVDAIERDRAEVPVGLDARLARLAHRLAPDAGSGRFGRRVAAAGRLAGTGRPARSVARSQGLVASTGGHEGLHGSAAGPGRPGAAP
ncbi:MAG: SDR family NAD(P)-dependent oxidoreductase [Actinomycetota bacterium]|nr:SDR family NAD(P)-dependent oxidoreductase [Actinomycetota bacterium]